MLHEKAWFSGWQEIKNLTREISSFKISFGLLFNIMKLDIVCVVCAEIFVADGLLLLN